jgi:hypothetical protein
MPDEQPKLTVPLPDFEVEGIVTVRDKDGNVKSEMKIYALDNGEEKKDGTS